MSMNRSFPLALAAALALTQSAFARSDLHVTSFSVSGNGAKTGTIVRMEALIHNRGNRTAGASHTGFYFSKDDQITSSDALCASVTTGAIEKGRSARIIASAPIPNDAPTGICNAAVWADHLGAVSESSESNNFALKRFSVLGMPDLAVQSFVTDGPRAGREVEARLIVKNIGNGSTWSTTTGFFLSSNNIISASDTLIGSSSLGILRPGRVATLTLRLRIPASARGLVFLGAKLNHDQRLEEISYGNNVRAFATRVVPLPSSERRIEWKPRLGTIALNFDTARPRMSKGGLGDMSVVAPAARNGLYVCVWSKTRDFAVDPATMLSIDYTNTPIFVRWLGRLDQNGHASPRFVQWVGAPYRDRLFTHALIWDQNLNFQGLSDNEIVTHVERT